MGRVSLPQGRGSQMHNRRDYERYGETIPANINQDRTHLNVTIVDKDIHEAYGEIFGDAVAAYNARQRRADRKIDNYYDYILKSKNGENLFYEDVLQWGDKDDFAAHPEYWDIAKSALVQYAETFEARNPNLRLIGAYIHMDERSPHLHFDYIPVATGYKKGLALRNSLEKAMRQMGYVPEPGKENRKNNATKLWKENERAYFADLCRELGLEVEPERTGRGVNLSVEEYKDLKDKEIARIADELRPDPVIDDIITRVQPAADGSVMLQPEDYTRLAAAAVKANAAAERADAADQRAQRAEAACKVAETQRDRALEYPTMVADDLAADKVAAVKSAAAEEIAAVKGENESLKGQLRALRNKLLPLVVEAAALWHRFAEPFRELVGRVAQSWADMIIVFQTAESPLADTMDALTPMWCGYCVDFQDQTNGDLERLMESADTFIDRKTGEIDRTALAKALDDDWGER